MKLKSLYCVGCGHRDLPINHYEKVGDCPKLPAPRRWLLSILKDIAGDTLHANDNITATRLLTCPRETAILDNFEIENFNVLTHNNIHWGNIMHADLEAAALPGDYAEVSIPFEGSEPPVVCGVPLRGKMDEVAPDFSSIMDYKSHSESAMKYPTPDNHVQLSLYAHLLAASTGHWPEKIGCWHGAQSSARNPSWRAEMFDYILSEDEILAHHPKDGVYTVADVIEEYKFFHNSKNIAGLEVTISKMKLIGRTMMRSKKCDLYCAAKEICDRLNNPEEVADGLD